MATPEYSYGRQNFTDHLGRSWVNGQLRSNGSTQVQIETKPSGNNTSVWQNTLSNQKELWETAFGQRQREAEDNASRAFRYRDQEANRQFGFDKDLSRQTFEQDRTIQGDSLASSERRDLAQQQAQERLQGNEFKQQNEFAGLQQRLKQRQQESERGAAMSVFRGGR